MKLPKKSGRWIIGIGLVVALYFSFTGSEGLLNLYRIHRNINELESEIEQMNGTIDSLEITIEKLKNDTSYIEKIAREKLGMAKKGEKIYKFVEEE